MTNTQLDNTLESGKVTRYHCAPSVRPQSIAHHSWNVAMLAVFVTDSICSRSLLIECLMHDTGEYVTGDIPFTLKRDNPELRTYLHKVENDARHREMILGPMYLSDAEAAILKVCDTLDGIIWCVLHEERHGPVHDRWFRAYEVAREKFATLLTEDQWVRADGLFRYYQTFNNPINHVNS
jgi:5'-deoxynucleotidase YfbR-like HD superfamily hydrolase